ncbi:MAG TPA: VWA-like domain-containing protein, partial [Candidatus Rifleibacterium sp.]|nr:VWA-like domain-containing protein [Candidatus Rifleibacterium sp.]
KGGGGTSHLPVFAHIDEQHLEPDLFIGISDLETLFPIKRPRYPVLWLSPAHYATPPWGHVIEIEP